VTPQTSTWIDLVSLHVDLAINPGRGDALPEAARAADAAVEELCRAEPDVAFVRLARRLELSREEQLAAWCLIASQLSPTVAVRLEALSGRPEVTLGALATVAYRSQPARAIEELGAMGRLFKFGLVESADDPRGSTPSWSRRTVRPTDRLLALGLATGAIALDPLLAPIARVEQPSVPIEHLAIGADSIAQVRQAVAARRGAVIVSGRPGLGRRSLLVSVARELGNDVLEIDGRKLSRELPVLRAQLRALAREQILLDCLPLIAHLDELEPAALELVDSELFSYASRGLLATTGPQRPSLRWGRPVIAVELPGPTSAQRAALWLRALGTGTASDGELLASRYPLAPAIITRAAEAAKATSDAVTPASIYHGIRTVLDDRLGELATRVSVTQAWDDLVLPQDQADTIVELLARIRERRRVYEEWGFATKVGKGLGVTTLFSGPPGTGKTMVAGLIARELGLELYQVDVAKIVSKFVGETEKQLGVLFDAAEAGHAVLLFDEADALFGKRTDVKSSNDRYANLETNYLLQRLESFTGICMLTSNHESNIDPAFHRRLSLHVRFTLPDLEERTHLWRAMLPADAPVSGDLRLASLAERFAMSGGYIRNAVLRAAFFAADEGTEITAAHLERGALLEYQGMGKLAVQTA
jgi:AAA+ superfamily predicted ATPase